MEIKKVLVVDDEERMRKLIHDYLGRKGYFVYEASNGEEALSFFYKHNDLDLIILDVMMPEVSGIDVLKEIRTVSKIPVIMLTAKAQEEDELLGFNLGADEYITKPFSPKILLARVEAILRRSENEEEVMEKGIILLDKISHNVYINGEEVVFSFKEFELLNYFMKNEGVALSRERILNSVWNYDYFGDARTIDTHVKKIRSKLGEAEKYIKTIWGMGYKFEVVE